MGILSIMPDKSVFIKYQSPETHAFGSCVHRTRQNALKAQEKNEITARFDTA